MKPWPFKACQPRALAVAMLGWAGAASAVLVVGPGGTVDQGRRFVAAVPAAAGASTPGLSLTPGVLQAVDLAAQQLRLAGRQVPLHPTQLRVLGPSGQSLGGAAALRPGMVLRFALEPADPFVRDRRIVLVYVDRQP